MSPIHSPAHTETLTPLHPKLLLTMREACQMLGMCRQTLAKLVKRGEIRVTRWGTRSVRFPVRELERFLERRTRKG